MILIGKTLIDINRLVAVTRANDAIIAVGDGTATVPRSPDEAEALRIFYGRSAITPDGRRPDIPGTGPGSTCEAPKAAHPNG